MAFGIDDAALLGGALIASSAANTGLNYFVGGAAEKRSNQWSESMSKELMREQFKFDQASMSHQYDLNKAAYDYSNAEAYRLAQAYAQNSASWNVEGLRRAGLNPILAATNGNFSGTYGNVGNMSGVGSSGVSGGGLHSAGFRNVANAIDIAGALRDIQTAKQSSLDTEIKQDTKPDVISSAHSAAVQAQEQVANTRATNTVLRSKAALNLAEAKKIEATARNLDANTALSLQRTENERDHGGVNSLFGLTSSLLRALPNMIRSYSKSDISTAHDNILQDLNKSTSKPNERVIERNGIKLIFPNDK